MIKRKTKREFSQKRMVMECLANGGELDRPAAFMHMGIYNLPEIVRQLREQGYEIRASRFRDASNGLRTVYYYYPSWNETGVHFTNDMGHFIYPHL